MRRAAATLIVAVAACAATDMEDPYEALLPSDQTAVLPRDSESLRRLLLANAQVAGEPPPVGLMPAPRVHPKGALVRLRYEASDERGTLLRRWDIRAVVPPIPEGGEDPVREARVGPPSCPAECRASLQRNRTVLLERSGLPGLDYEWVMRMPVGRTFALPARTLVTQDIHETRPTTLPAPATVKVTVVDACAAELRAKIASSVDVHPHAIVPVPSGTRRVHWVELGGCPGAGESLPLPLPSPKAAITGG